MIRLFIKNKITTSKIFLSHFQTVNRAKHCIDISGNVNNSRSCRLILDNLSEIFLSQSFKVDYDNHDDKGRQLLLNKMLPGSLCKINMCVNNFVESLVIAYREKMFQLFINNWNVFFCILQFEKRLRYNNAFFTTIFTMIVIYVT